MDEFKSVKSADSQMSFIFTDARKNETMDIFPTRRLHHLRDYFLNYSYEARASVKTVVVDMNAPYTSLIRDVFPKAIVIIDRFHLVQLVMRSLNQTRIKLMNRYNTSRPEDKKVYRKLKSYWKLLLKNKTELSDSDYRYQRLFKGPKSSMGIIDYIMTLDVEFKATYQVAQNLLVAVQHKNISAYQTLVLSENKLISPQMKRSLRTLKKYLPEIANSFKYNDSNGHLEGINNKIKMIKRISFGYRNFTNFRNRILLGFNNKRVAS
ncbi:ISL3 family transposase [Brochothrix thermosphacta]|uniref:ISL3 family transposase n=1 Tax=Brochothrix thermosphacta TaxID=2756 RepID=UPI0009C061F1|nr:ISL3 family transposase [Brochothrix thermosphacta]